MEINLQGGIKLPQALPSARSADFPVTKKVEKTDTGTARVPEVKVPKDDGETETKRFEQLQRAAQSFFKDVYAVSDTTFSIFKDTTGQYITRFTSLRDGKVTYIPEPQMLQYLERKQQARRALVEISV
jgi:hypothetical protein